MNILHKKCDFRNMLFNHYILGQLRTFIFSKNVLKNKDVNIIFKKINAFLRVIRLKNQNKNRVEFIYIRLDSSFKMMKIYFASIHAA